MTDAKTMTECDAKIFFAKTQCAIAKRDAKFCEVYEKKIRPLIEEAALKCRFEISVGCEYGFVRVLKSKGFETTVVSDEDDDLEYLLESLKETDIVRLIISWKMD